MSRSQTTGLGGKVIADTNLLVRIIVRDDPHQAQVAADELANAALVVVSVVTFIELVWTLIRTYGLLRPDVARAVRQLMNTANVALDRPAVTAGLAFLDAGQDFADGVLAHLGTRFGGETFLSFDRKAVAQVTAQGGDARRLM